MTNIKNLAGIKKFPKKCSNSDDDINIDVYVINCQVNKDRLATFKKYMDRAKLDYQVEDCVNGKAYTEKTLTKMVKSGIVSKNADLTPIEVAICLSHFNCWQRFLAGCGDYCLVLEDDVKVHKDFKKRIMDILKGLEDQGKKFGPLIIHPGNWMSTKTVQKKVTKIKDIQINRETVNHNPSGSAYILTRKFAKHLINKMFPIKYPVDIYIGDNLLKSMPHLTLVPTRDKYNCWSGPLLSVKCGGDEGSTQDYDVDNVKQIYKKSLVKKRSSVKRRSKKKNEI